MKQSYRINDCCGLHLEDVTIEIPDGSNPWAFTHEALQAADREQHICDGCYDNAYSVTVINL